ncbi:GtrA family protein [Geodermatophilus sp. SYSU D01105]
MTSQSVRPRRAGSAVWSLVRQVGAFGVVGAVCFVIDVVLFQVLYAHLGLGAVSSKAGSTVVSMAAAFVGHRYWSFADSERTGLRREGVLFTVVNGLTLLLGLGIIAFARYALGLTDAWSLQAANLTSIAVGTVVRFVSYRFWVFPTPTPDAER